MHLCPAQLLLLPAFMVCAAGQRHPAFSPPEMIFLHLVMASPSRDVFSSASPCHSLPVLHHHICRLPSGFPRRLYCSSGRGWLIRRQLHLTVLGSFSDGFSTAIDTICCLWCSMPVTNVLAQPYLSMLTCRAGLRCSLHFTVPSTTYNRTYTAKAAL